jgi:hypothetical protein
MRGRVDDLGPPGDAERTGRRAFEQGGDLERRSEIVEEPDDVGDVDLPVADVTKKR